MPRGHRLHALLRELQEGFGLGMGHIEIAYTADGLVRHGLGECLRRAGEVILGDDIEQRGALECRRGHGGAGDDHVDRGLEPHETRKSLRAAGAGNQAELHFGEGDFGIRQCHPVVAAQRELESAPMQAPEIAAMTGLFAASTMSQTAGRKGSA